MLFFKCKVSSNELASLERYLPNDICISKDLFQEWYYGVLRSTAFNELLNVLSGHSLEQLEYLSAEEFGDMRDRLIENNVTFGGNTALLKELS